jgi:hypothetical protein
MPQTKDLYMNFRTIATATDGTATNLVEQKMNTGLSVRGRLIWLIHQLELHFVMAPAHAVDQAVRIALCTVEGLAAMPNLQDKGVIAVMAQMIHLNTNGEASWLMPWVQKWLPPVPIAAPNISLYVQADFNNAGVQNKPIKARLGFTTLSAEEPGVYTEIAETWGY